MNNLGTEYRVNEQGMIVELIEKLDVNESEQKVNPQDAERNSIPADVVIQS